MIDKTVPSFADAKARFRTFLESEGFSPDVQWVFRESIVERWPRVFVKVPMSSSETVAEDIFDRGRASGLGVLVDVFCFLDNRPCCYIWLPEDNQDAARRMLSGLKFSVPADPGRRIVIPVKNQFRWRWLKWREPHFEGPHWADNIPFRSAPHWKTVLPE